MPIQAPLVSDQLHSVLLGMIEDSQEQRLSLEQVSTVCQKHIGEAEEEVDQLVTYVLGTNVDVSGWLAAVANVEYHALYLSQLSSSEYGDLDMDDANLESEVRLGYSFSSLAFISPPLPLPSAPRSNADASHW